MSNRWTMVVATCAALWLADHGSAQQRSGAAQCPQPATNCQEQGRGGGCQITAANPVVPRQQQVPTRGQAATRPATPPNRPLRLRQQGRLPTAPQGCQGQVCQGPDQRRMRGRGLAQATAACQPPTPAPAATAAPVATLPPTLVVQVQGTLADEFLARDFYLAAAERFGDRRFANLARAEQHHVDALTTLLRGAGAEPVAAATHAIELPADRAAVEATAAEHERAMIAAYDVLLAAPVAAPVHAVFERIQNANRRHLAATSR